MSMRKWVRGMAHAKATRKGYAHVNKRYGNLGSYFSQNWREIANDTDRNARRQPRYKKGVRR